jgi:hypothetical protein
MRKPLGYYSNRNYIASIDTFRLLSSHRQPNSDYIPIIDSGAERAFYLREKVDLFDPLANSILAYQELTESQSYTQILKERYAYYANYKPDQRILSQLVAQLANASERSNWQQMEGMLYQLMPAPILRDLWFKLDVVAQFREYVEAGIPPKKTQLFFQFLDNVAHNRFTDNAPVIRGMVEMFAGQRLGPVIIRALAVNAAILKDRPLYELVLNTFVHNNADIGAMDRNFMQAIQAEKF